MESLCNRRQGVSNVCRLIYRLSVVNCGLTPGSAIAPPGANVLSLLRSFATMRTHSLLRSSARMAGRRCRSFAALAGGRTIGFARYASFFQVI